MGRAEDLLGWTNRRLAALGHDPVELPVRPERALVGFDGHTNSQNAGLWAGQIADQLKLLTVEPPPRPDAARGARPSRSQGSAQWLEGTISQGLSSLEASLEGAEIDHERVEGRPAEQIREGAIRFGASLLAIGYHNASQPEETYGSIAEELIHEADQPTLVARRPPARRPITGAVGRDEGSRSAAAWAAALAAWLGLPLRLVHSEETAPEGFEAEDPGARARLIHWPPPFGLTKLEDETPSDLVVLGERVVGGGLGSTAVQIARRCDVSLFIARRPEQVGPSGS